MLPDLSIILLVFGDYYTYDGSICQENITQTIQIDLDKRLAARCGNMRHQFRQDYHHDMLSSYY
jgi:hypothetical protein